MDMPKRKHQRLQGYDYSQNGTYFVTINTYKNRPVLAEIEGNTAPRFQLAPIGKVVEKELLDLPSRFSGVTIDKFVIMPTHMHAILVLCQGEGRGLAPAEKPYSLTDVIGAFKSLTTRKCNQIQHTPGAKLWQTSFYDKIIRNEESYREVWNYIHNNPEKWCFVHR